MPPLIPAGYGNRRTDPLGNVHTMTGPDGMTVFRHPGRHRGRHRRPPPFLRLLALWEGVRV